MCAACSPHALDTTPRTGAMSPRTVTQTARPVLGGRQGLIVVKYRRQCDLFGEQATGPR